jgi:hypothetical protein
MTDPQVNPNIYTPESQVPTPVPNKTGIGKLIENLEAKKLQPVKVHLHDRFYSWMSGKKTFAGIVIAGVGATLCLGPLGQVVAYKLLGESLLGIGSTILTGGLVNKVQKASNPTAGQVVKTDTLSLIIAILKKILEFLSRIK